MAMAMATATANPARNRPTDLPLFLSLSLSRILLLLAALLPRLGTALDVALPFNAQLPPVARVAQAYSYQLAWSTFAPPGADRDFGYSLSQHPPWLALDSGSRTLRGTPGAADVGAVVFVIRAVDAGGAVAEMGCTLVVSPDPAPVLSGSVGAGLEVQDGVGVSGAEVRLEPGERFGFGFQQDAFIDVVKRELSYYAVLADHTPLPGWLQFRVQGDELAFSGAAPGLAEVQEGLRWSVLVVASDVKGFAGATAGFSIVVDDVSGDGGGGGGLGFAQEEVRVEFREGEEVEFRGLAGLLTVDGSGVGIGKVRSARAEGLPGWARFDDGTLEVSGIPGDEAEDAEATVTVAGRDGDEASVTVRFAKEGGDGDLFQGTIGELTARAGQKFSYQVPGSVLSGEDLTVFVVLPPTATWLSFDAATRVLSGDVPSQPAETTIKATLTARSSTDVQSQVFTISIQSKALNTASASIGSKASPTSTSTSSASAGLVAVGGNPDTGRLTGGTIAAIAIVSVVAAALLLGLLIFCCRRRRQRGYQRSDDSSETKRKISRPILPVGNDVEGIIVTTQLQSDVEKLAGSPFESQIQELREQDRAPQIALNLPDRSARNSKWSSRFSRYSHVSSIGDGEAAIRGNEDIPVWGAESAMLQLTPHQSFSVPAAIARHSRRHSELSPSKRALKRLRERHRSAQSIGLGIDSGEGSLMVPTQGSRRSGTGRGGGSSTGLSVTMERSSRCNSVSTKGTSVLSTRVSDFPRPPVSRSTLAYARSRPSLTDAEKRASIRLVNRSDSIVDERSIQDKRSSFIRNRRKSRLESPFLAHGSRASSGNKLAQLVSGTDFASSSNDFRRSRRGRSGLTSYSASSSLDPGLRESRRLSQRVRSTFAPNFPRAITRSSLGATQPDLTTITQHDIEKSESSRSFYTTSSSISSTDLRTEMALPRHQRTFVLPGEASPTPPPLAVPHTSRASSRQPGRNLSSSSTTSGLGREAARQRWKDRLNRDSKGNIRTDTLRPASPLSTAIAVPAGSGSSLTASGRASQIRRSGFSDPRDLVSQDSLNGRGAERVRERPKLVHTASGRPVSVESVGRLSSLRAQREGDAKGGGEEWEEAGLMPRGGD